MKRVKVTFDLSIGFASACHKHTAYFDFEDDATKEEIENELEEYWKEWSNNYIEGGWEIEE